MTLRYQKYRDLVLEIFYAEDGSCYASCEHAFKPGVIVESQICEHPKQAFDRLKSKINFIYADYRDD